VPAHTAVNGVCQDVYENTRTYGKFDELDGNCMSMMINELFHKGGSSGPKKIPLKFDHKAGMLLKTHIEKMSALRLAKMSMKIKDIDCFCQDVYENKGTCLKPMSKTEMGRASMKSLARPAPAPGRLDTGKSACATHKARGTFAIAQAGVPVPPGLSTPNAEPGSRHRKKDFK